MTNTQMWIMILAAVAGTVITRFTTFVIFKDPKTIPKFITYLGTTLPFASVSLLVVYCLKDSIFTSWHSLPEVISIVFVMILHFWKRNMLLSILLGTILYMFLVQNIFI